MIALAEVYRKQGRSDEAEEMYLEALEGRRRVFGEEHPATLNCMGALGDLYVSLGRAKEAEGLHVKAVDGLTRVRSREHPETGTAIRRYGVCLMALGRYEEAEERLLEAHGILVGSRRGTSEAREAVRNLVELYEVWGKQGKEAEWRAELAVGSVGERW